MIFIEDNVTQPYINLMLVCLQEYFFVRCICFGITKLVTQVGFANIVTTHSAVKSVRSKNLLMLELFYRLISENNQLYLFR